MRRLMMITLLIGSILVGVAVGFYATTVTAVRAAIAIEPFPGVQRDFWIVNVGDIPILRIVIEQFDANDTLHTWTLHTVLPVTDRLTVTPIATGYVLIHFEDYHGWQTVRIDIS